MSLNYLRAAAIAFVDECYSRGNHPTPAQVADAALCFTADEIRDGYRRAERTVMHALIRVVEAWALREARHALRVRSFYQQDLQGDGVQVWHTTRKRWWSL